jgi:flagellar biosynthesis/type III secretory pathway protein FliH
MKTKYLTMDELQHYAPLGVVEGITPDAWAGLSVDDLADSAYHEGYDEGFEEGQESVEDRYDEGFEEGYDEAARKAMTLLNVIAGLTSLQDVHDLVNRHITAGDLDA